MGGQVGLTMNMDDVENRKLACFCWELNCDSSVIQSSQHTDYTYRE